MLQCLTLVAAWHSDAVLLRSGDFQGLEVLGTYSEDPIVITSDKLHGVILVNMIGKDKQISIRVKLFIPQMLTMVTLFAGFQSHV